MLIYEIRRHDVVEVITGELQRETVVFRGADRASARAVADALAVGAARDGVSPLRQALGASRLGRAVAP